MAVTAVCAAGAVNGVPRLRTSFPQGHGEGARVSASYAAPHGTHTHRPFFESSPGHQSA